MVFQEVETHDPHLSDDRLTRLEDKVSPMIRESKVLCLLRVDLDVNQLVDEEDSVWDVDSFLILFSLLRNTLVFFDLGLSLLCYLRFINVQFDL